MAKIPVEELFVEFRRGRDPSVLAEVFDRTAVELHRVARHVAGGGVEAEDCVQQTFLRAIERGGTYEEGQPLLPWLLGILVNELRMARRRARRRARVGRARQADDPVESAERGEVSAAVRSAIAGMDAPYGEVVALNVLDEVAPAKIARRLGRSPSTVRSQLQRGLEKLRAALPAGLGVAAAPPSLRALDGVRAAVLARASEAAPVAASMSLWMLVPLGSVVLLGAAGALLAWIHGGDLERSAAVRPAGAADVAAAADPFPASDDEDGPPAGVQGDQRGAGSRIERPAPDPPAGAPVLFAGRCRAAETGAPLAGCAVTVTLRRFGVALGTAASGADGSFRVRCAPPEGAVLGVRIESPGRVTERATFEELDEDRTIDLGDVNLMPGHRVHGRVVGEDGRPIAAVGIDVESRVGQNPAGGSAPRSAQAETGPDGRFELEELFPVGPAVIFVRKHGFRVTRGPWGFTAIADSSPREFVIAPMPAIRGVVVDERGAPVAGVQLDSASQSAPSDLRTRSRDDGSFELFDSTGRAVPLALTVGGHWELAGRIGPIPWATDGARVVVRALPVASLDVIVVEQETGAPVETFAAVCQRDPQAPEWQGIVRGFTIGSEVAAFAPHRDGRVRLEGLHPGANVLQVNAPADAHASIIERVRLEPGSNQVTVAVRRALPLRVRVETRDGAPVPGSRVEAIERRGPRPLTASSRAAPLMSNPHWESHALLSAATTDAEGTATVYGHAPWAQLAIRVTGPDHAATLQDDLQRRNDAGEVVVTVDRGARLRGRIEPAAIVAMKPLVRLTLAADESVVFPQGRSGNGIPLDDGGRFEAVGVPPGRWRVILVATFPSAMFVMPYPLEPDVAIIDLPPGGDVERTFDARALAPGRLTGTVMVDGRPVEGQLAGDLQGDVRTGRPLLQGPVAIADGGGFDLPAVAPATYRLRVQLPGGEGRTLVRLSDDLVRIDPGGVHRQTFRFPRRTLRLRVLDGEAPVADRWFTARSGAWAEELRSDARGIVVIDHAPLDPLLLILDGTGRLADGLRMPPDRTDATLEVHLRERD